MIISDDFSDAARSRYCLNTLSLCVSLCAYVCDVFVGAINYKNTDDMLIKIGKNTCYD